MLKFGHITNIEGMRARIKIDDMDGFVTDWLAVIVQNSTQDNESFPLDIDTPVAALMDEECEDGVIVGAIYTDLNPPKIVDRDKKYYTFKDGTHIEYDRKKHKLTAKIVGDADISAKNLSAKIENNTLLETKELNVNVNGSASIKAASVILDSPIINLGVGGLPLARLNDTVLVDVTTGKGTITSAGVNTSL